MNNTNKQFDKNFYPILATYGNESSDSLLNKWDHFDALSKVYQDKVSSIETAQKVSQICAAFNLNQAQSAPIAIIIRSYYFNELKLEDMPFYLAKEIPIDLAKAKEITNLVVQKIINDNSQEIAYQAQLEHLPIYEAMKVFPEIGEQMITTERISLKNFPEPVRPSLKNWLADYTFTVGYDNKDSIKRGNYIFHGNNTLRLTSVDREKLAHILKAHDEQSPITIDKVRKQIVFPDNTERHSVSSEDGQLKTPGVLTSDGHLMSIDRSDQKTSNVLAGSPQSSASLHDSVSFSSPQQLPYEKLKAQPPFKKDFVSQPAPKRDVEQFSRVKFPPYQPPSSIQPTGNRVSNVIKLEPKPEKPRELPRNVVNLKEF